ncbi:lysine transporter LysE [Salipiger pallidus]|uniref:Lysine transporter LysE n=1 Tax=Salipiger pallidus TaxID=1775170 RepID=A0A8J2ZJD3_9RHOB|nr:LysE family translocator [Salipiger pallidus]GGG70866.1 lysine transporter LysE [Salipiger pallidus]
MTPELLLAILTFALVSSITPGPNNLMLMSSGATFGFRRSLPHMAGITLGYPLMLVLVGLGAMQVFDRYPAAHDVMRVVSVLYMLWLALRIARAAPPDENEPGRARPLGFFPAAAFQWVNPKGWSMALGAITLYAADRSLASVLWVAACFLAMSMVSTTTWTVLGREARRVMGNRRRLRIFNIAAALLLVISLYPVLIA